MITLESYRELSNDRYIMWTQETCFAQRVQFRQSMHFIYLCPNPSFFFVHLTLVVELGPLWVKIKTF